MQIRPAINADHDAIWNIFHEIIAAGDTYAFDPQMPREEALAYWFRADTHTYVAEKSIAKLLAGYRQQNFTIKRAALVVGSQIDPHSVTNRHIRAHALEGRLFRSVLQESLHAHRILSDVLIERDAYARAAVQLKQSNENVRRAIQKFGRDRKAPWRAEQKLSAVAAWVALG